MINVGSGVIIVDFDTSEQIPICVADRIQYNIGTVSIEISANLWDLNNIERGILQDAKAIKIVNKICDRNKQGELIYDVTEYDFKQCKIIIRDKIKAFSKSIRTGITESIEYNEMLIGCHKKGIKVDDLINTKNYSEEIT